MVGDKDKVLGALDGYLGKPIAPGLTGAGDLLGARSVPSTTTRPHEGSNIPSNDGQDQTKRGLEAARRLPRKAHCSNTNKGFWPPQDLRVVE
jgi:hypothetical protein